MELGGGGGGEPTNRASPPPLRAEAITLPSTWEGGGQAEGMSLNLDCTEG